jgi:hypothetical protein
MDNTKKQTAQGKGGLKERMQDVYFEFLPPNPDEASSQTGTKPDSKQQK